MKFHLKDEWFQIACQVSSIKFIALENKLSNKETMMNVSAAFPEEFVCSTTLKERPLRRGYFLCVPVLIKLRAVQVSNDRHQFKYLS